MTKYTCSACGLAVLVLPDQEPIRACRCHEKGAGIVASISAVTRGVGAFARQNQSETANEGR